MAVQRTYGQFHDLAYAGQLTGLEHAEIFSRVASENIDFGLAIVRHSENEDSAKLPSQSGEDFVGISQHTTAGTYDSDEKHLYLANREMNIIRNGEVWVYTEQVVKAGDNVYFRHTAEAAPNDILGGFRKDASGGNADKIEFASFESEAQAGELAKVKLYIPRTGKTPVLIIDSDIIELPLTAELILLDGASAIINSSLPNGKEGQNLSLKLLNATNAATITPDTFADGTTLTFSNINESAHLMFANGKWHSIAKSTATIA